MTNPKKFGRQIFPLTLKLILTLCHMVGVSSDDSVIMPDFKNWSPHSSQNATHVDWTPHEFSVPDLAIVDMGHGKMGIRCRGHDLTSLSIIKCDTKEACQAKLPCLTEGKDCSDGHEVYRGQSCSENPKDTVHIDCLDWVIIQDGGKVFESGLIVCKETGTHHDDEPRIANDFFVNVVGGQSNEYALVSTGQKVNAIQLSVNPEKMNESPKSNHVEKEILILKKNENLTVMCFTAPFFVQPNSATLKLVQPNETEIGIDSKLIKIHDDYHVSLEGFEVRHKAVGISCTAKLLEKNEAVRNTVRFHFEGTSHNHSDTTFSSSYKITGPGYQLSTVSQLFTTGTLILLTKIVG